MTTQDTRPSHRRLIIDEDDKRILDEVQQIFARLCVVEAKLDSLTYRLLKQPVMGQVGHE